MLHSPGGKDISAAEVDQAALPEDNLLRQVSYQGQREDKPAPKWCDRFHTSDVSGSKILSPR